MSAQDDAEERRLANVAIGTVVKIWNEAGKGDYVALSRAMNEAAARAIRLLRERNKQKALVVVAPDCGSPTGMPPIA